MSEQITKNKGTHIASISLGVMAVGFAVTLPLDEGTVGLLIQDGFEAGLVGGLADWFAVTALFRHPMGIPIPHTALLPKNRDKVTKALVSAIENELLNKESILAKISKVPLTQNLIELVEKEIVKPGFHRGAAAVIEKVISTVELAPIAMMIEKEMKAYVETKDLFPLLLKVVDQMLERGYEEKGFDYVLTRAEEWILQPETRDGMGKMALEAIGRLELNGLMQFAVNAFMGFMTEDKLGAILQNLLLSTIFDLRQTENPNRERILSIIRAELDSLGQNEMLRRELDLWKHQLIEKLELEDTIRGILTTFQQRGIELIREERFGGEVLTPFITKQLTLLKSNPAWIQQFESMLHTQIIQLIETHHLKIGKLVQENLDKLDNKKLTELMEDKIGEDLQWIRVNGALCGFLIGLVLGAIKLF